jgi:type II secretory pathway component PulF
MLTIAADERAALQFEDVASALDAGLPLSALGGDAGHGEAVLAALLQQRGVRLSPTEHQVLQASWQAGRAGATMRSCAAARRQRAEFQRQLWAGLRYPLTLLAVTTLASLTTMRVVGHSWFFLLAASLLAACLAVPLWIRHALRTGNDLVTRLPRIGGLVLQFAELPYLETLQSLYASGVPLAAAHRAAMATVNLRGLQQRLAIADHVVQEGRPLADGLMQAVALHAETRTLLATGERTGTLEEALGRALTRRREVTSRGITDLARHAGHTIYVVAAGIAAWIVVQFWVGYYAAMHL